MMGFAHRGAPPAGVRDNSLAGFAHALKQGVTGLESDIWLTADGVPVLVHDPYVRARLRRRMIAATPASALPHWLPSLADLYESTDATFDLSVDLKDPAAAAATVEVARAHGRDSRLWICGNADHVRRWQQLPGDAHLVVSTTLRSGRRIRDDRIEEAADSGAAALNLRASQWTAEYVARCHERGMLAWAWKVEKRSTLATMTALGCDAVFSDSLKLLTDLSSGRT
jgi:glycerophosphoryl diester phosphodiesterase